MDEKEVGRKLQAPFPPEEIEWRVGSTTGDKSKGLALPYVTNRAIQNRLDEVCGCFGWKNDFKEWKNSKSQLCSISILHNGEWITKWDGADDSNTEATKGGLSDSMKRAAYQWGIGRYLYKIPQKWVTLKQQGRSYALAEIPTLPDWALPDSYKKSKSSQTMRKEEKNQSNVQDKEDNSSQHNNKHSEDKPGEMLVTWGKHKDKKMIEVVKEDKASIRWGATSHPKEDVKEAARKVYVCYELKRVFANANKLGWSKEDVKYHVKLTVKDLKSLMDLTVEQVEKLVAEIESFVEGQLESEKAFDVPEEKKN